MRIDDDVQFIGKGDLEISTYGEILKLTCPVCGGGEISNVWRIPMASIDPPITVFGGYFNQIPTLRTPFQLYCFDACKKCESVFLNPDIDRKNHIESYKKSTHYIKKMVDDSEWAGYEDRYKDMVRFLPESANVLVDAACGMGQILFIARKSQIHNWQKMIGLELSEAYVKNMLLEGIEAHCFDLDKDDPQAFIPENSVDFISFFEAFEHVQSPLVVLGKMLDLLRLGGRIYFSAQRYGVDVNLSIRPGEPIYIGSRLLELLPEIFGCIVVNVATAGSRYFIVLEKTDSHKSLGAYELDFISRDLTRNLLRTSIIDGLKSVEFSSIKFEHESDNCYLIRLGAHPDFNRLLSISDNNESPSRSPVSLLEDGVEIGPSHSTHASIRNEGMGAFSHWGDSILFSTSDNSNPNNNGRVYEIRFPIS